ncbi:MAG: hypothetical protein ABI972_30370 [Acidobacteriota bacterium]
MHTPKLLLPLSLIAFTLQAQQPAATPSVCASQRFCAESNSFAAIITDFRTSNVSRYKVVTAAVRFQNKLTRPVILGYVSGSGVTTDDQGNRYGVTGADGVRGLGLIANNQVDPKFVIRPGETGDARIEMVWGWSGREVFGLNFEMEFTVREMGQLPSGQFRLGPENPLRFRGLANNLVSAAPQAPQSSAAPLSEALGDGPVLPAVTPAPAPGTSGPSIPAQAAAQGPDLCIGVRNCFNAGAFAADIQNISSSVYGGRHHILRFNVRIRNASSQQLILAQTYNSSVVVDNAGQRYGQPATQAVTGIGVVSGRSADPQFVLNPGQSRDVAFQVMRRNSGNPTGVSYTFDTSLEQLEILPSQQVRFVRQFSLNFPNLAVSGMSHLAPGTQPESLADTSKKIVDIFKKK